MILRVLLINLTALKGENNIEVQCVVGVDFYQVSNIRVPALMKSHLYTNKSIWRIQTY